MIDVTNAGGNFWVTKTSILLARHGGGKFVIDGFLYYTQGVSSGPNTWRNNHERYDDSDNSWLAKASHPVAYASPASFSLSLGYMGYGDGGSGGPDSASLRAYNESSNVWISKTSGGVARRNVAGQVVNGYGFVLMGRTGSTNRNTNERYDEESNSWSTKAVTSWTGDGPSSFIVSPYMYVAGARLGSNTSLSNGFMRYDSSTDVWFSSFTGTMSIARAFANSFSLSGYGYLSGGFNANVSTHTSLTESFDASTNAWVQRTSSIIASEGHIGDSALNGNGYQCAGSTGSSTAVVGQYRNYGLIRLNAPIYKSTKTPLSIIISTSINGSPIDVPLQLQSDGSNTRHIMSNSPKITRAGDQSISSAFEANATSGIREYIVKVGTPIKNNWLTAGAWTIRSASALPVCLAGRFAVHGFGYIIAGMTSGFAGISSNQRYDRLIDTWSIMASITFARHGIAGIPINGLGFAVGGTVQPSTYGIVNVERYTPEINSWSTMASLPAARGSSAAFNLNSFAYSFAGFDTSLAMTTSTTQYSDSSNSWTTKASYPLGVCFFAGGTMSNLGFGTHGADSSSNRSDTHAYNDAANAWIARASGATPRSSFASFDPSGKSVIANGSVGSILTDASSGEIGSTDEYIDSTDVWLNRTTNPVATLHTMGLGLGREGYVVGGISGGIVRNFVESYSVDIAESKIRLDFLIEET